MPYLQIFSALVRWIPSGGDGPSSGEPESGREDWAAVFTCIAEPLIAAVADEEAIDLAVGIIDGFARGAPDAVAKHFPSMLATAMYCHVAGRNRNREILTMTVRRWAGTPSQGESPRSRSLLQDGSLRFLDRMGAQFLGMRSSSHGISAASLGPGRGSERGVRA
ncbi:hypothetical protein BDK51DRAFT_28739 [Blyttiomyces helicus]|uniref:Uncharacterized protein n=1 Tax=Blyttiomyces helicus TaxID=388810 RepID=A0A4P9WPZ6_9FUNG|nr:hypothetical protein BDK51DRAFT_28739 [Blyttiomyces helicus]|eukprot:RKO94425.1 hypothetical protein BDK51DRAFT_28739 [Blyttiomyces helicus]